MNCSQGCEVSIKEVDTLMSLLSVKKRKMEQDEAEKYMQALLDFLYYLRKQKVDELSEVCGLVLLTWTMILFKYLVNFDWY